MGEHMQVDAVHGDALDDEEVDANPHHLRNEGVGTKRGLPPGTWGVMGLRALRDRGGG